MSEYKLIKSDIERAERALLAMADGVAKHGRALFAVYLPLVEGALWLVETVDARGAVHRHQGETLEDAYQAALHWPETPPSF